MTTKPLTLVMMLMLGVFGLSACSGNDGVEAAREDIAAVDADRSDILSSAEADFVTKSATSHMQEIDAAKLAMTRTQNNEVKDFADMLVNEHQEALDQLGNIMDDTKMSRPGIEAKDQATLDTMGKWTAAQFDREYITMMVDKHQKALETHRAQLNVAQNGDLKDYVEDFTPNIEKHLEQAQELQRKLGSAR